MHLIAQQMPLSQIRPHPFGCFTHRMRQECSVLRSAGFRVVVATLILLTMPTLLLADGGAPSHPPAQSSTILFGFVGGFVHHDNPHHGPVFLAKHMHKDVPKDAHIEVFENRHRKTAYRTILHLLDTNHDGVLTNEEKAQARIVLFGQSWGGSAVVMLARDLDRAGIPVLLTVQVDSVAKPFEHDGVIPTNVAAAANFYQPHGLIHGRSAIRAEDHSKTEILGNYRYDYNLTPVKCEGFPWVERTFIPGHMHTECDTHLWGQVESLVRQRLEPDPASLAVAPQP
jgi:hypothetical protein